MPEGPLGETKSARMIASPSAETKHTNSNRLGRLTARITGTVCKTDATRLPSRFRTSLYINAASSEIKTRTR